MTENSGLKEYETEDGEVSQDSQAERRQAPQLKEKVVFARLDESHDNEPHPKYGLQVEYRGV
jgi:hypothetical protein